MSSFIITPFRLRRPSRNTGRRRRETRQNETVSPPSASEEVYDAANPDVPYEEALLSLQEQVSRIQRQLDDVTSRTNSRSKDELESRIRMMATKDEITKAIEDIHSRINKVAVSDVSSGSHILRELTSRLDTFSTTEDVNRRIRTIQDAIDRLPRTEAFRSIWNGVHTMEYTLQSVMRDISGIPTLEEKVTNLINELQLLDSKTTSVVSEIQDGINQLNITIGHNTQKFEDMCDRVDLLEADLQKVMDTLTSISTTFGVQKRDTRVIPSDIAYRREGESTALRFGTIHRVI